MKAKIVKQQDNLLLWVNGKSIVPAAYMSYLEDNADYVAVYTDLAPLIMPIRLWPLSISFWVAV